MRLVLAALLLVAVQANAQFWDATSGPPTAVTCMASNDQGHVFVGTPNSAVYRTTDFGNSWVRLDQGIDNGSANFHAVETIKVAADGTLYAGVKGFGLMRSRDNGEVWEKLDLGIEVAPSTRISVSTEKLPDNNIALFVGYDGGAANLFMYYSSNGGDSFESVPRGNIPAAISSIFETFMSPNSDLMFVLVSYNKGLYRSSNMGKSWTRIDSDPNSGESDDNFLTMTANREGVLYIGRNALPSSTKSPNACIMRSTNDGTSWEYLIDGWDNRDITNNRIRGIAFGPGQDVWAITEKTSGVFYSSNGGETWISQNEGLPGGGSGFGITVAPKNCIYTAPLGEYVYRHLSVEASVDEGIPVRLQAGSAYPNPTQGNVSIDVTLDVSSTVLVSLANLQGIEVVPAYNAQLGAGSHTLRLHTESLSPGMYTWRMMAGAGITTGTFIIL